MSENENAVDLFIGSALAKCNLKQQKFISKIVLGEDAISTIKEVYNIGDDDMAEIKKMQLMSIPEVNAAISELQKGASMITKAKINSMLPTALDVIQKTIEDADDDNKWARLNTSKDILKMGLDMNKEDNKGKGGQSVTVKIDNVKISTHSGDASKIARSFMGVVEQKVEEVEEVKENKKIVEGEYSEYD